MQLEMYFMILIQQLQPKNQIIPHDVPGELWEVIGVDIFQIKFSIFCLL